LGDDTSGHVDDLSRFVAPRTVVTIVSEDSSDPDYEALTENLHLLQSATDQDGHPLEILTMVQPKPVLIMDHSPSKADHESGKGFRIPASYANFYIANTVVIAPVFGDSNDAAAIDVLSCAFPTRRIVPIDSRELTWGFGSFHCVTQQVPAGKHS
jgi:agmatine deiminase